MGTGDAAPYTPRWKIHNVHWLIKTLRRSAIRHKTKNLLELIKAVDCVFCLLDHRPAFPQPDTEE